MESLLRDLRLALRSAWRRRGASALIIGTLALGIGANVAIFGIISGTLLRPLPFRDADRLVQIGSIRGGEPGPISMREIEDLREQAQSFERIAAYVGGSQYSLRGKAGPEKPRAILMTHDLFAVLGVPLRDGGPWPESFDRERSFGIVLSNELWRRQFDANANVVGTTVSLDASPFFTPSYQIYGVVPEGFDFPARVELYRSIYISRAFPNLDSRTARNAYGVARLRPGVTIESARREVEDIARRIAALHPQSNEGVVPSVTALRDVYVGGIRSYVYILAMAGALVLVIAATNTASMLLSQLLAREGELAIRHALGASRWRLARQLLAESVSLAMGEAILGTALAYPLLHGITSLIRFDVPTWMTLDIDVRVLAFAVALALIVGILVGLVPIARLEAGRLGETIRSIGRGAVGGLRQHRVRSALVIAQVALSVALLVGAGALGRTFVSLLRANPGFDDRNLLTFQVSLPWTYPDAEKIRFQQRVLQELAAMPRVSGSALNANLPLTAVAQPDRGLLEVEGQPEEDGVRNPYVDFQRVSEGYFALMGIPVLAGRTFAEVDADSSSPRVAAVSERLAARLWPGDAQRVVGRRIRRAASALVTSAEPTWVTVVGVARDVRADSLDGEGGYDVYLSARQYPDGWTHFLARTHGDPMGYVERAKQAVWSVDAGQAVFDIKPMRERVLDTAWRHRLASALFGVFAAVALLLAATGIYGVTSYVVRQRTREIGVRIALGAQRAEVIRDVIRGAVRLVAIGTLLGAIAAIVLSRLMASLVSGVASTDVLVLSGVVITLLLTAFAAALIPALRASRVDPIVALRSE